MQNSGNLQEVLHGSMVQNNKLKGFISSALLYSSPSCSRWSPYSSSWSEAAAFPVQMSIRPFLLFFSWGDIIDSWDAHYIAGGWLYTCSVPRPTRESCLFVLRSYDNCVGMNASGRRHHCYCCNKFVCPVNVPCLFVQEVISKVIKALWIIDFRDWLTANFN